MNLKHFISLLCLTTLITGCDLSSTYESDIDFEDGYWHMDSLATFQFEAPKESQDIELKLRSNLEYPFYNLYIKMELADSTGKVLKDSLVGFDLYDAKTGKPLGQGNSIYQLNKNVLEAYPFPYDGKYSIRLAQYMRRVELSGIVSAGVRIAPLED